MKKTKFILYFLLFTIILVVVLPFVFPYQSFIPDVEKKLSDSFRGKVTVGRIEFQATPRPQFVLADVVVDNKNVAQIGEIAVPVTFYNVLQMGAELRGVTLSHAKFSHQFLAGLHQKFKAQPDGGVFKQVGFSDVSMIYKDTTLGPVEGTLRFKPDGQALEAVLSFDAGAAELLIQPGNDHSFNLRLTARGWDLPSKYDVKLAYLSLLGNINETGLNVTDVRADLYTGLVTGSAHLDFGDTWQLTGSLNAADIDAGPLLKIFSDRTYVTGRLSLNGSFRFVSDKLESLFAKPEALAEFKVQKGKIYNIDIVSPLKTVNVDFVRRGGSTDFNTFNGVYSYNEAEGGQLQKLAIDYGRFRARGAAVLREGNLNGQVTSQLVGAGVTVSSQLQVSGRLAAPEIRTMAGARMRPPTAEERTNGSAAAEAK